VVSSSVRTPSGIRRGHLNRGRRPLSLLQRLRHVAQGANGARRFGRGGGKLNGTSRAVPGRNGVGNMLLSPLQALTNASRFLPPGRRASTAAIGNRHGRDTASQGVDFEGQKRRTSARVKIMVAVNLFLPQWFSWRFRCLMRACAAAIENRFRAETGGQKTATGHKGRNDRRTKKKFFFSAGAPQKANFPG